MWNPFRSKLAASILGGIKNIYIKPGTKVLYLGAASGTTVSHVSDIVGLVSYLCVVMSCLLELEIMMNNSFSSHSLNFSVVLFKWF